MSAHATAVMTVSTQSNIPMQVKSASLVPDVPEGLASIRHAVHTSMLQSLFSANPVHLVIHILRITTLTPACLALYAPNIHRL